MVEPASYEFITLIKRLAVKQHQSIDLLLRPYDLARSQYVMLYYLSAQPGVSTTELAEKMMVEPATLSGIADALQSKALVERVEHSEDKRRKDIKLTDEGLRLVKQIPPPGPGLEAKLLRGITGEEQELFKQLGYKMLENLEHESTEG